MRKLEEKVEIERIEWGRRQEVEAEQDRHVDKSFESEYVDRDIQYWKQKVREW